MKVNKNTYHASFTAAGLLHHEILALKDLLLSDDFNTLVQKEEKENQLLGLPTQSARKRIILEIKRRNNNTPHGFWNSFYNWSPQEQKLGLFFLCLKSYPLMLDFHIEVTLKKFNIGSGLEPYDITMRLDELSSQYSNVASWTYRTKKDLNSRYRQVIREAGLFDGKKLLKPAQISQPFWDYFHQVSESWFLEACFEKR